MTNPNKAATGTTVETPVTAPAQDPVASPTPAPKAVPAPTQAAPTAPKANVPTLQEELATLRASLSSQVESYLQTIDSAAKRLSNGPDGVAMTMVEIHQTHAKIFRALQSLFINTPDSEFSAAMYSLLSVVLENSLDENCGMHPKRIFAGIGYHDKTKALVWINGKTDADREWFCGIITALLVAIERGGKGISQTRTDALTAQTSIRNADKGTRLVEWMKRCNALKPA